MILHSDEIEIGDQLAFDEHNVGGYPEEFRGQVATVVNAITRTGSPLIQNYIGLVFEDRGAQNRVNLVEPERRMWVTSREDVALYTVRAGNSDFTNVLSKFPKKKEVSYDCEKDCPYWED